jgi:hypothetical protein
MKPETVKSVFGCCVGTVLLASTLSSGLDVWQFKQTASSAVGVVVHENAGCAHVDVRFVTANGETIEYPQNGSICLHPGQKVRVLYDPSMPLPTASADSAGALWFSTFVTGAMGVRFLLISGLNLLSRWRADASR